ncbi:MAG: hypothetical protein ACQETL_18405 [Bacteroidota bacterium]
MKIQFKTLLGVLVIAGSTLFIGNNSNASSGYDGICCQRLSGSCEHPNGMTFEKSTWISGSSTCTGHEEEDPTLEG